MTNFKICPSFFSPTEQIVPHVHNVQCWLFNSLKVSYLCHINHFIRRYRLFFDQQNTIYNSTGFSPKNKWVKIEMTSFLISHWEEWEFSSTIWNIQLLGDSYGNIQLLGDSFGNIELLEYSPIGRNENSCVSFLLHLEERVSLNFKTNQHSSEWNRN